MDKKVQELISANERKSWSSLSQPAEDPHRKELWEAIWGELYCAADWVLEQIFHRETLESPSLKIFENRLDAILCNTLQDPPAGRLDQMIHCSPFQLHPFCETRLHYFQCSWNYLFNRFFIHKGFLWKRWTPKKPFFCNIFMKSSQWMIVLFNVLTFNNFRSWLQYLPTTLETCIFLTLAVANPSAVWSSQLWFGFCVFSANNWICSK